MTEGVRSLAPRADYVCSTLYGRPGLMVILRTGTWSSVSETGHPMEYEEFRALQIGACVLRNQPDPWFDPRLRITVVGGLVDWMEFSIEGYSLSSPILGRPWRLDSPISIGGYVLNLSSRKGASMVYEITAQILVPPLR